MDHSFRTTEYEGADGTGSRDAGQPVLSSRERIIEHRSRYGRPPVPFVWQSGRRLLLLDEEASSWVFAELEFDSITCRYAELRRGVYDIEREAVGVLLSRALASGMQAVEEAALSLNAWLLKYYGHSINESRTRPRTRVS